MDKFNFWSRNLLAMFTLALLGFTATPATALVLGNLSVKSSIGEVLQADIEVVSITPEEASSLSVNVASPTVFLATGVQYQPILTGMKATLNRRPDGSTYIHLSTELPVNEPFVDVLLETSWASGRTVRDFTMLFDLPADKDLPAPAPTLPQTSTNPASPAKPANPVAASTNTAATAEVGQTQSAASIASSKPLTAQKAANLGDQQVLVKPGDTASKIALAIQNRVASLNQMLVAMLRANPEAFVAGNLNRLRAGAMLDLPSTEQSQAIDATEATRTVLIQNKDFNAYRRNLAQNAPTPALESASRAAQGNVQSQVETPKPTAAATDKLTLSKGVAKAQAEMSKLAQERNNTEAAQRSAELAKNIADLKKLSTTAAPAQVATSQAASAPALSGAVVPKSSAASAPATSASQPAAAGMAKAPDLLDQLLQDPLKLAISGAAILLAILGGVFWYRRVQAQRAMELEDDYDQNDYLQSDQFSEDGEEQQLNTGEYEATPDGTSLRNDAPVPVSRQDASADLAPTEVPRSHAKSPSAGGSELDFDLDFSNTRALPDFLDSLSLELPASNTPSGSDARPTAPATAAKPRTATASHDEQEFDLSAISLDLDDTDTGYQPATASYTATDLLETKLVLAEEFIEVGDYDGARTLLEEILTEANGDLRERTQRVLSKLD